MSLHSPPHSSERVSHIDWDALHHFLWPLVIHWVYSSCSTSWSGQEDDIVADIVQEAIFRTFRHSLKIERGAASPIDSVEHFGAKIAYHFYIDTLRRSRRFVRLMQDETQQGHYSANHDQFDLSEVALHNVSLEFLFVQLARDIVKFPEKQKTALLTDLANHIHFDVEPSALERAFLRVGIQLRNYQQPLPTDPTLRSRHASLLSLAYKRVKQLGYTNLYPPVA